MSQMSTEIERTHLPPETRAAAISYLTRTGNTDIMVALGLAPDPVAEEKSAAKARAMLNGHGGASIPAGYQCGVCNGPLPSNGICRKTNRCRAAEREFKNQRAERGAE